MKMELLDHKQRQIGDWESINSEFVEHVLSEISSKEDFTLVIEHPKISLMYITVDRGHYALLIQLSDNEFYDYISSLTSQGEVEFVEGGQNIKIDRQYLAPYAAVCEAVKKFTDNPDWVKTDSNWKRQT